MVLDVDQQQSNNRQDLTLDVTRQTIDISMGEAHQVAIIHRTITRTRQFNHRRSRVELSRAR